MGLAEEVRAKLSAPTATLPPGIKPSALTPREDPESSVIRLNHRLSLIEDSLYRIAEEVDKLAARLGP